MGKSKEQPVRIECMGGCGKHQMIRPSKIDRSVQFYGCGKCPGYLAAVDAARVSLPPLYAIQHTGIAGFIGWRIKEPLSITNRNITFAHDPKLFPLEQWFDLSKRISREERELIESEMMLRVYKNGLRDNSTELSEAISALRTATRQHNAKFEARS